MKTAHTTCKNRFRNEEISQRRDFATETLTLKTENASANLKSLSKRDICCIKTQVQTKEENLLHNSCTFMNRTLKRLKESKKLFCARNISGNNRDSRDIVKVLHV